jgi:hypothetical protein
VDAIQGKESLQELRRKGGKVKIVMERFDTFKLRDVTLAIDVDNDLITIVATQKRNNGTYEVFHRDQFSAPE